jgi:hypothetical protein
MSMTGQFYNKTKIALSKSNFNKTNAIKSRKLPPIKKITPS